MSWAAVNSKKFGLGMIFDDNFFISQEINVPLFGLKKLMWITQCILSNFLKKQMI